MTKAFPANHVHGNTGEANPNWTGGFTITNRGYRKVLMKGHPRADRDDYVLEHICVAEIYILKRPLTDRERVHHKDGNKLNNSPDNLIVYPDQATHLREGHSERRTGTIVKCDTCGTEFYKRKSTIGKYNFCKQEHNNPNLWIRKKGN